MTSNLEFKENCAVCGTPLVYGTVSVPVRCSFCNEISEAQIYCPQGHYVCDACHRREAVDMLYDALSNSTSADPMELLELLLSHPSVTMHGPEHHVIVPAVIVTAVKSAGYPVPEKALEKAMSRGQQVPGGWCGSHGDCGAAIGVGIAVSVLTGATPLSGKERSLSMKATAFALSKIVDDFPRCCKRSSRRAIEAAVDFLRDNMDIKLEIKQKSECNYSDRNQQCVRERCTYFKK